MSGNTLKYLDKKGTPRKPSLQVIEPIRQSDMSTITSWDTQQPRDDGTDPLSHQYASLEKRLRNPTSSLSSRLLQDRNLLIKKFGEESAELIAGYVRGDSSNVLEESQQVLWVVQMMLLSRGLSWSDLQDEVKKALIGK